MTLMSEHATQQWHLIKAKPTDPQHMRSYRRIAHLDQHGQIRYPVICVLFKMKHLLSNYSWQID